MPETKMHESKHAQALMARPRFRMTIDVTGCYGHTGEPMPKVGVPINEKKDDNEAIEAAHVAAALRPKLHPELGDAGVERLTNDRDFIVDMKTTEALWRAFRDVDDPDLPAWPTPEWMKARLDSDVLAALLDVYNGVRQ